MKFSRVGDHTIKCTISEAEIDELGFSLDEILTNGNRTQEFMNLIFDRAENEFQTKFDFGIKTVRADFLPDHTLSLTFSGHTAGSMTEHLKDIIDGLLHPTESTLEEWQEAAAKVQAIAESTIAERKGQADGATPDQTPIIAGLVFDSLDVAGQFAANLRVEEIPPSVFYKYLDVYVLIANFAHSSEKTVETMSREADEYAVDITVAGERLAHITEHGKLLLKEHAIEQLKDVYATT